MIQIEIKLKSRIMLLPMQALVLLPDEYSKGTDKKNKVLWALHGGTQDYDSWLNRVAIDKELSNYSNVICVIPNGLNSDFANHSEFGTGYNFSDYFFNELMPFIYNTFPASSNPVNNYITGYSMGGAGALMLGLNQATRFNGIAPMGATVRKSQFLMPYLEMHGYEFRKYAKENRRSFPTEYGDPKEGITDKEINMVARYDTVADYVKSMECTIDRFFDVVKKENCPEIYFCCGEEDGCTKDVIDFVTVAKNNGADNVNVEIINGYNHENAACVTVNTVLRHFFTDKAPKSTEEREWTGK